MDVVGVWVDAGFTPAEAAAWQAVGPDDFRGTNLLMADLTGPTNGGAGHDPWPFEGKCRVPVEYGTSNSQVQARGFNLYLKDADDAAQEAFFRPGPFAPAEAAAWRAVGVEKPVRAADWRRFGLGPAQYAMYLKRRIKASWSAYVTHTQLAMTPGEGLDALGAFSVKEATKRDTLPRFRALDEALRAGVVDVAVVDALVAELPRLPRELERDAIAEAILDGTLDWTRLQRVYEHVLALTGLDPAGSGFVAALVPYLGAAGNTRKKRWRQEARTGWDRDEAFEVILGLETKAALDKMARWATEDLDGLPLHDIAAFLTQDVPLSWVRTFLTSRTTAPLSPEAAREWRAAGFSDEDATAWAAMGPQGFTGTEVLLDNSKDWSYLAALQVPVALGTSVDGTLLSAANAFLRKATVEQQEEFFRPSPFTPTEAAAWRTAGVDHPLAAAARRRLGLTPDQVSMYMAHGLRTGTTAYLTHRELRMTPGHGLDLLRSTGTAGLSLLQRRSWSITTVRQMGATLRAADAALRAGTLSVQLAASILAAWPSRGTEHEWQYTFARDLPVEKVDWVVFQRVYDHVLGLTGLADQPTDDPAVPVPAGARPALLALGTRPGWGRDEAFEAVLGLRTRAELDRMGEFATILDQRIRAEEEPVLTLAGVLPFLAQDVPVSWVTTYLGSR